MGKCENMKMGKFFQIVSSLQQQESLKIEKEKQKIKHNLWISYRVQAHLLAHWLIFKFSNFPHEFI